METVVEQQPLAMDSANCCGLICNYGGDFYKQTNISNDWRKRDPEEDNLCLLGLQGGIRASLRERYFEYMRLRAVDPNVYAERVYESMESVSRWKILQGCLESIFCLPFQVFRRILDCAAHEVVCLSRCSSSDITVYQKDVCRYHTGILCGDCLAMPLEVCYTVEKVLCFPCDCFYVPSTRCRKTLSRCPESLQRVGFFDDVAGKLINPKEPFTSTAALDRVVKKQLIVF